jgi:hypothetical protein
MCPSMINGVDPIKIDKNVRDCIGILKVCLKVVLYCNGELDDKDPSLDKSPTS